MGAWRRGATPGLLCRLRAGLRRMSRPIRRAASDAVGADRRETVEADRSVARGVGARRQDLDLVADFEPERQPVFGPLVENVGAVAGRPGEDHRPERAVATR